MEAWQLYLIIGAVIAVLVGIWFFIKKVVKKKVGQQEDLVSQHKVATSILVLNKRRDKVTNASMPKAVMDQIPKIYKVKKVPLVRAKIGPQVMDLLCDEKIFDKLPEKKTVTVELAGIFIAGIKTSKKK